MSQEPTSGPRIRLGISACLLGKAVRYDDGHKRDRFLRDTVGRFVEWVPICPEVECGLPVPREPMHIVGSGSRIQLITEHTREDHTNRLTSWANGKLEEPDSQTLCGYVLKSRSPSCGTIGVRISRLAGDSTTKSGAGIFARILMKRFPFMPVENDERFHDPERRESFITRALVWKRWLDFLDSGQDFEKLTAFHAKHELLILAHSPNRLRVLGNLAASTDQRSFNSVQTSYIALLMNTLKRIATRSRQVNALRHAAGYIKKRLGMAERTELIEAIERYRVGYVPLTVPVELIQRHARHLGEPHLMKQVYLNTGPVEQMLRDHI